LPGFGIVSEHPELFDINYGNVGNYQGQPDADWGHYNCVSYNPELDQIIITSRHFNEIYIIDHSTTSEEASDHSGGIYGKGGDFLYRWGNPFTYDSGSGSDIQLSGPHSGVWIPAGYPGEGNVLIFNNNYAIQNSAVFEIEMPSETDGIYFLEEGEIYGPDNPEWIYTGGFFSQIQSGAFRLPNGNTVITSSNNKRIIEVDQSDTVVWQYNYSGQTNTISRSLKYGTDYFDPTSNLLIGDVNEDTELDVLDVIIMVNIILGNQDSHPAGDMNDDEVIDVLDVIVLVNIILGGG